MVFASKHGQRTFWLISLFCYVFASQILIKKLIIGFFCQINIANANFN